MRDKLTLRAKREGYLARSAYKLLSLNSKYNIIKKGDKVLDLGCWPGSWIQVCLNLKCDVTGVDIKKVDFEGVNFIEGDIYDKNLLDKLGKFNVVLSDLAPKTTGIKHLDQARSLDLAYNALDVAKNVLKEKGNFLCKIFQSNDLDEFVRDVKKNFVFVKMSKPEASKKRSKEIYLIAKSKHNL
ncbi:MAG: RlmE family RNA methyltransferase [Nanoarchaeota archaeon]|nr:RlmE family RNA methyltransferase [Nanoarchaeota archaeon]